MSTMTLEKRVATLEKEVRILRSVAGRSANTASFSAPAKKSRVRVSNTQKKLPRWLQDSLDDVKEGRVSGPFNTVEELMAHLRS